MSDDTRTPPRDERHHQLAAAYLDGVATPEEQAEVEASPELQALVATFRAQADALRAVAPAPDARREAALATALAEFTGAPAAPVAPPLPTNVVAFRRNRRIVSIAAGVAAAGVLGVVGISALGSSSDRGAGTSAERLEASTLGTGQDVIAVAGDTSDAKSNGSAEPGSIQTPIVGPATAAPEITTEAELRELAQQGTDTAFVAPSFELSCSLPTGSEVVTEITWQGTPALVLRDTVTGLITAIDAQCTVLASVEP